MKDQQTIIEQITKLSKFQLPLYKIEEVEVAEEEKKMVQYSLIAQLIKLSMFETNDEIIDLGKYVKKFAKENKPLDLDNNVLEILKLLKKLDWGKDKTYNYDRPIFKVEEVKEAVNEVTEYYQSIKYTLFDIFNEVVETYKLEKSRQFIIDRK